MKGKTATENKGYAFVMFKTKELASEAMKRLNNTDLKVTSIESCWLHPLFFLEFFCTYNYLLHDIQFHPFLNGL